MGNPAEHAIRGVKIDTPALTVNSSMNKQAFSHAAGIGVDLTADRSLRVNVGTGPSMNEMGAEMRKGINGVLPHVANKLVQDVEKCSPKEQAYSGGVFAEIFDAGCDALSKKVMDVPDALLKVKPEVPLQQEAPQQAGGQIPGVNGMMLASGEFTEVQTRHTPSFAPTSPNGFS